MRLRISLQMPVFIKIGFDHLDNLARRHACKASSHIDNDISADIIRCAITHIPVRIYINTKRIKIVFCYAKPCVA